MNFKSVFKRKQVLLDEEATNINKLLEDSKKGDPEENRSTEIPPDEHVRIRSLWIVEAYPPTYFANLKSWLSNINQPEWSNNRIQESIEQARLGPDRGWFNLGRIFPLNSNRLSASKAILPKGVEYVDARLFYSLPSITFIVLQFVFNETTSLILEDPLNKKYDTYAKKLGKGYEFIGPSHQKQEAVLKLKKELHQNCSDWVKGNMPGVFSTGVLKSEFPTCEFITIDKQKPFVEKTYDSYLRIIDLGRSFFVYDSEDTHGLRLMVPSFNDSDFSNLILAGNTSEILSDKDLSSYGDRTTWGFTIWLAENFIKTVYLWGLYMLLTAYEYKISIFRDSIANIDLSHLKESTDFIDKLEKELFLIDNELPYFGSEYELYCKNEGSYKHGLPNFKMVFGKDNKEIDLFAAIRETSLKRVTQLPLMLENLRHAVVTNSQTINTKSNLRIQRAMLCLTRIMALLTLIMALLTSANIVITIKIILKK